MIPAGSLQWSGDMTMTWHFVQLYDHVIRADVIMVDFLFEWIDSGDDETTDVYLYVII